MEIDIEFSITGKELAAKIALLCDRKQVLGFLERLSSEMDDEQFDIAAAALFTEIVERWG